MKAKTKTAALPGALAALLATSPEGFAPADNPGNASVTAPVARTIRLSVSNNAVDFGGGSPDPEKGYHAGSPTATVRPNADWMPQAERNRDLNGTDPASVIPSGQPTFPSSSANPRVTAIRGSPAQSGATGPPAVAADGNKGYSIDAGVDYGLAATRGDSPDACGAARTGTVIARRRPGGGSPGSGVSGPGPCLDPRRFGSDI